MMFRAKELRSNLYGLVDAWRDGGYSEDWITLTLARYHNRTLAVPKSAIFPNQLGELQLPKVWNFMCRQIFVLTRTYATGAQRFIAIGAMGVNASMHAFIFFGTVCAVPLTALLLVTSTSSLLLGSDDGDHDAGPFGALGVRGSCVSSGAVPCVLAFWVVVLVVGAGFKWMLVSFAALCNVRRRPTSIDSRPALVPRGLRRVVRKGGGPRPLDRC